jgi:hypothetical protein
MKKVRTISGVAAGLALVAVAHRIGLANVTAQLRNLGVVLPIMLFTGFVRLLLQTRAWAIALRAEGIQISQWRLIGVRLSSQAAGYLIALGPVVSEPTKLALLRNPAGMAAAAPATLFETGAFWFSTMILGLAGACSGAFLIGNARAVSLAVAVFGMGLWFLVRRQSLLSPILRVAGGRAPKWLRSAEQTELQIRSFRDRQREAARNVLVLDSIGQLVTLAEVAAVFWAAGIACSFFQILTIEAGVRVVKILGAWVPGRIGMDEGGSAAAFALLGFSPAAGLMLAVARRVRDVLWCAIGIMWTAASHADLPTSTAHATQPALCMQEH